MVSIIKSRVLRAKTRVRGSTLFSADTNRNIRMTPLHIATQRGHVSVVVIIVIHMHHGVYKFYNPEGPGCSALAALMCY